jgi:hypothetical protein
MYWCYYYVKQGDVGAFHRWPGTSQWKGSKKEEYYCEFVDLKAASLYPDIQSGSWCTGQRR